MTEGPVGAATAWDRGIRLAGTLVVALVLLSARASAATVGGVDVASLAGALENAPVQVVSPPAQSPTVGQVDGLRTLIHRLDDGRIWVAVVRSMGRPGASRLSNGLAGYLNADGGGAVIVVAGPTVWGSTSWEDAAGATSRLSAAFRAGSAPLVAQLRAAIRSFASGDAAAGHPRIDSAGGPSTSQATGSSPTRTGGSGTPGSSGGGVIGPVVGAVIGLGVLAVIAVRMAPEIVRARRMAHWRREEHADALERLRADVTALGEAIESLDIDTSMPGASDRGKDEYAQAMDCYQEAERRLQHPDDDYQFQHARLAVRTGLEHIHAARALLDQQPSA